MLLPSKNQIEFSSLARYLDGEFWEIKDAFRDAISVQQLGAVCGLYGAAGSPEQKMKWRLPVSLELVIAVRYSHSRRQFGPKDQDEVKIIEHQTQYLRPGCCPRSHLHHQIRCRFDGSCFVSGSQDLQSNRALQALVAGLKACSTWENIACLQDCRECTGGMVVVRELLTQYPKLIGNNLMGLIRNWTSSVSALEPGVSDFLGFSMDKVGDLMFLLKAVSYRERELQHSLTSRLYSKVEKNKDEFFMAWNACLHHVTTYTYTYTE
ncbi:hypothetical protein cypCar_00027942 [Cyprinus carpio]|nr:hypothetical protein cypCar_00027942 [Cyprinus carpio]